MELLNWGRQLLSMFARENGEVGDAGMVGNESIDSSGDSQEASFDGFDLENDTTGANVWDDESPQVETRQETQTRNVEESFVDPSSLPPELKAHWSRMHRSYTQALEGARSVQQKASVVDRFQNDPAFATQTFGGWAQQNPQAAAQAVAQWAQANGLQLVQQGQQPLGTAQQAPQQLSGPMAQQVEAALRQQLKQSSPELEWMAPSLAPAMWAAIQQAVAPLAQAQMQTMQERQQTAQRNQAAAYQQQLAGYDQIASRLSETHPGWESNEGQMAELLDFINGSALEHPQFGSKLELLYNLATGGSAATQRAVKRMNDATRLRAGSGKVGRSGVSNIADRVANAKSRSDAFRIAGEAALAQLG